MAPKAAKTKAQVPKKEEPAAKKAKTEEPKKEEPKVEDVVEDKSEKEKDAPTDSRPKIKDNVTFDVMDCTLNVLPTMQGKVLMSLSDGGMQFLIAGARANVGVKSGRYMFEAKVIEALNPAEAVGNRSKAPLPRQLLRVGFSTAGSQLVLGETEDGVCFDAEGCFTASKQKKSVCQRFGKNQSVAVLLNLDDKSPNAHTVSLFLNGERYTDPQPLPEGLKGKTLFPHISYRNVSVQVNFGAQELTAMPFKCRTIQTAAVADVVVAKSSLPKDGKYEVMFPVAFPDEGTFAWLDTFLETNPKYVELSDRKIMDWAAKSGLVKPKSNPSKNSNDKPDFNYGLTAMDDLSVSRVIHTVAPFVPRNYVVMEVKENLTKADREANLKRFSNPIYKKVARVVMGEPGDDFKSLVHSKMLKQKKDKAVAEWKTKKAEKERKKGIAARQKQLTDIRKKAEEARKKAEAERKAKAEEAKKKKEEEAQKKKEEEEKKKAEEAKEGDAAEKDEKAEEGDEKTEDTKMEDATKETDEEENKKEEAKEVVEDKKEEEEAKEVVEDKKEEEEAKEEEEEEDDDQEPPEVELTEEDKKTWFVKPEVTDLSSQVTNQFFGKFTIPEKAEGFDEISYEWEPAAKANSYLRTWVLEKKVTAKMEDLKPSDWFKEKHGHFTKSVKEWKEKQQPFVKKQKEEATKKAAAAAAAKKEGVEEEAEEEVKVDDIDIFAVEDICDTGNGEPLFVNFGADDWALLNLRYELFLLQAAFKHDVDDEERPGIHESTLSFYYNKYYHRQFAPKFYGKERPKDVFDLVKDAVTLDQETKLVGVNDTLVSDVDTLDIFVKLTEDGRRERQRRMDAGDETARLKLTHGMLNQVFKPPAGPAGGAAKPAGGAAKPVGAVARPVGQKGVPAWAAPGAYGAKGAWGAPAW